MQNTKFVLSINATTMSSPLKLLLLCAALLTSCGERTASLSSTMSLNQTVELDAAFERLEIVLQQKAPKLYASLSPGASEEEIEKLRSCLGGNRVEALERWFSRHNGASEELLPSGLPINIDRSIEDLRILQTIPFVPEIRRNAVKILCDSAGDGFFVDVNTDTPLVFHHILEDPENPVWFGTLAEFVNYIATGFESGIFYQSEDGKFAHDESGYEEMMDNYLHLASRWN